jgi:glycosyltransferase involved in cell wall biosynthesis
MGYTHWISILGVEGSMKKVFVRGPALSQSGYGEHTRFVLRSLRSQSDLFDIYLVATNWGQTGWLWEDTEERQWIDFLLQKTIRYSQGGGQFDISLQVTIPNEWEKIAPINIGVTAGIETTKIAPVWVEKSFLMDKIIVVSEHARFGFENTEYNANNPQTGEQFMAKVTCPIDVVGYPVKEVKPVEINLELKDEFNFLTVGTWIPRKNLENTIKWFIEEFYDQEVGLIVKTSLAKNSLRDRRAAEIKLQDLLHEYKGRKCNIYLLHGDLNEREMTGLYQHPKVKALINIGHGEGFGLPMFEAAYNALPIMTTPWGGQCDFLYMPIKDKKGKVKNTPMFAPVSYDIKEIQPEARWEGVIQADSQWCFAKEWSYKKALKSMFKSIGGYKSKAKKLQKYVLKTFSCETQYDRFCDSVSPGSKKDLEWMATNNTMELL